MDLFVLNKSEEFICRVRAKPPVTATKAVVISYCRDPSIPGPNWKVKLTIDIASELDIRGYSPFVKYLKDRQKIAILKLGDVEELIYACASPTSSMELTCYVKAVVPDPQSVPARASTALSTETNSSMAKPAGGGFLSNLLGKVSTKAEIRSHHVPESTVDNNKISSLESETREKLQEFLKNTELNELSLEPMDKSTRFIVHEIVEEFADLVSASVGDNDTRHVIVYRRGFEPPDVQLHLSMDILRSSAYTKRKTATAPKPAAVPDKAPTSNIIKIEGVKRDRRSIEEIQMDIKRRKLEHPSDSHGKEGALADDI